MNDQTFAEHLRTLASAVRRPNPTAAWKADILACAQREAAPVPISAGPAPRWLFLSWAAMWIATLSLYLVTPREARLPESPNSALSVAPTSPSVALDQSPSLFALEQRLRLDPDLP